MDENDAPEIEIYCGVCGSYVHEYLSRCPACGTSKPSTLAYAVAHDDGTPLDTQMRIAARDYPELADRFRATDRRDWARQQAASADHWARTIEYRYLGGLPGFAPGVDVSLRIGPEGGVLADARSGQALTVFAGHQVLSVVGMPRDNQLDNWFGVFGANVGVFFSPTIHGGALRIIYAQDGGIYQFTIGDRTGILASHGSPEYHLGLSMVLGSWASASAAVAEDAVGARGYARELGFSVAPATSSYPRRSGAAVGGQAGTGVDASDDPDDVGEDSGSGGDWTAEFDGSPYHGPHQFVTEQGSAAQLLSMLSSGSTPRNVLLTGPSASASEVAFLIARLSHARYVELPVGRIERSGDLVAAIINLGEGDAAFVPDLDALRHEVAATFATTVRERGAGVDIGRGSARRTMRLGFKAFTLVVWAVSGTIPEGMGPWDYQLAFGSEADQLVSSVTHDR